MEKRAQVIHDLKAFRRSLWLHILFAVILVAELAVAVAFICIGNNQLSTKIALTIIIGLIPTCFFGYKTYDWIVQIHQLNKTISEIRNLTDEEVELFYIDAQEDKE